MTTSTQKTHIRVVEGREIPTAGRWALDPVHSQVQFVARHMMVSKVRGFFRELEGMLYIEEAPELSRVEVTIQAASIDTGDATRDEHLRSPDFLDVERYPEITYRSTRVQPGDGDKWYVAGLLTIRDITRPVPLTVEFCGVHPDPWGKIRAGFLATTEIDREEFDITWNQALEAGGFLVGKGVKIEIDAEAVREDDGNH
jgi:polyisoprenoid-binding protein YceI